MSLRLCCFAPRTTKLPRSSSRRSGIAIERVCDRNCPVVELAVARDLRRRAFGHDLAAVHAGARSHVHEPVGAAHHLLVVLDDDDRVADVAQPLERPDESRVVALVQPDRRLVEDVQHADELRADLRRETKPLRLSARQRRCGAVEREVADADVVEEREPLPDLLDDAVADQLLRLRQAELVEERERARDRHLREFVDRPLADGHREHFRLEPRALAHRARAQRHVFLDPLALLRRVRLLVAALEARDDPVEREHVLPPSPHAVAVLDVHALAVGPVQEAVLLLLGQLRPRLRRVDLVAIGDRLDDGLVEAGRARERPGHERAVVDRERRIGHEQVGVDLLLRAEAGAARARAVRRVEREDARLQLRQRHAVIGTGEVLREEHRLAAVERVDEDDALGEAGRGLDRLRQPQSQLAFALHDEPVDDHFDRVLELLVERRHALLEDVLLAVDLHAREPLALELLEHVLVLALAVAHDRRVDGEARPLRQREHLLDDRVDRLPGDGAFRRSGSAAARRARTERRR